MTLALNNLQKLICHKTKKPNQSIQWVALHYPWSLPYNVKQGGIKNHFLESLVSLDLGLKLGLPDIWRTFYLLGHCCNCGERQFENSPKSLMLQAAAGIGLRVNAHKTEYLCFNQTGDISTLDGTSPKLVDKFTYLGNSVSSTEKDIDTRLTKTWTATDKLSIIWKSDLTDKMKRSFSQAVVVSILLYGCTT